MFQPSRFERNVNVRPSARTRNLFIGPASGGAMGNGTGNLFIGNGAGAAVVTGKNNVIIGGYAGSPDLNGAVVLSNGTGKILSQWDESGTPTHTVDDSDQAPDPRENGSMTTSFNAHRAALRYRIRDLTGRMRTIEISAAPDPVAIPIRPVDVTQATGDVTVGHLTDASAGALTTMAMTTVDFTGTTGRFDFIVHSVPTWAGGAVFDWDLCVQVADGSPPETLAVSLRTQDGMLYYGYCSVPAATTAGAVATIRVAFMETTPGVEIRMCSDGNLRPMLGLTAGDASSQLAALTLERKITVNRPTVNRCLRILGMVWRIAPDATAAAFGTPILEAIPPITGSTADGNLTVPLALHQTQPNTGPLTWTITGPPTGVSIDPTTGVLVVKQGTRVEVPSSSNPPTVLVTGLFGECAERQLTFNVTTE